MLEKKLKKTKRHHQELVWPSSLRLRRRPFPKHQHHTGAKPTITGRAAACRTERDRVSEAKGTVRPGGVEGGSSHVPLPSNWGSLSCRRFESFAMSSTKEPERRIRLLPSSNLGSWYVHSRSPHGRMRFSNIQGNFDALRFLRGELEELPPMHNPVVVIAEGRPKFKGVRHHQLLKIPEKKGWVPRHENWFFRHLIM